MPCERPHLSRVDALEVGRELRRVALRDEAADALGITEADFYAKTSGVSNFTRTERDKLAKLLGLDETERNYIFREEEK